MRFTIPVLSLTRHQQDPPVELDGFFEGANGTGVETGLERIQARFDKQRTTLQKDSVERTKHLEAEVSHLDNIKPGIDKCEEMLSRRLLIQCDKKKAHLLLRLTTVITD